MTILGMIILGALALGLNPATWVIGLVAAGAAIAAFLIV